MADDTAAQLRPKPSEAQRLGAEFVGTFFLTLVAAGADVIDYTSGGQIGHTARYLASGCLVTAMIWTLSAVSGAHINPAVTFAFVLRRCFPLGRAAGYWAVQFVGAIAAAATLRTFFNDAVAKGATQPGPGVTPLAAASWEGLLTLLLVLVILGTAEEEAVVGKNAALAVGLTVALCGLFSSPISGASMNPARSFGPQLVSGHLEFAWVYFVGPFAGATLAAAVAFLVHGPPRLSEREAAHGKHR
jgi:aquaporin Z